MPLEASTPAVPVPDLEGGYFSVAPPVPVGTFDIGLVMAGAISAGAYTAGVLDFLIEALDAFEEQKAVQRAKHGEDTTNWEIPGNNVRLRVMAGASAGSIAASVAAVALRYRFKHVRSDTPAPEENPFYRAWVSDIDIKNLLKSNDLAEPTAPVNSLLDCTSLAEIGRNLLTFSADTMQRPYLGASVRYVFSVNNLRGVPYFVKMRGNTEAGFGMVAHGDYDSFAVRYNVGKWNRRADDMALEFPNNMLSWAPLVNAGLASGAFPAFLVPRPFEAEGAHYQYRFVLAPDEDPHKLCARRMQPLWDPGSETIKYSSMLVDGGTINNEPLELARTELAGLVGCCPRKGEDADRATIMIDPFPDYAAEIDDTKAGQSAELLPALLALLNGWKAQARFASSDLALADASNVYSRFMIAPDRHKSPDSAQYDLACGGLGGFSGFLSERFRRHDYLLGRRNCQQFLRRHFEVPVKNTHVMGAVNPALKQDPHWAFVDDGEWHMPLIPLFGDLAKEEPLPEWPARSFAPESLMVPVTSRIKAVSERLIASKAPIFVRLLYALVSAVLGAWLRRKLARKIVNTIRADLKKRNLVA